MSRCADCQNPDAISGLEPLDDQFQNRPLTGQRLELVGFETINRLRHSVIPAAVQQNFHNWIAIVQMPEQVKNHPRGKVRDGIASIEFYLLPIAFGYPGFGQHVGPGREKTRRTDRNPIGWICVPFGLRKRLVRAIDSAHFCVLFWHIGRRANRIHHQSCPLNFF